tara:strand:- start:4707 stop:4880 length:174 start_codon:yes stop_codon:yes gene_type:complete
MNKEKLAIIITRLQLCNNSKLESIEEYLNIKKYLLELDDDAFFEKTRQFGLFDKEAS